MIDANRVGQLTGTLSTLAQTAPAQLWAFFKGCKSAGFNEDQAENLTVAMLKSVLAVPSPVEQ